MAYEAGDGKDLHEVSRRSRGRGVLCPRGRSECAANRQDLRQSTESGRDSRAALQDRTGSSRRHALSDSQLRRSVARRARSALRAAVCGPRARRAARAPHAGAHVYARRPLAGVDRHQHSIARRRHQARRLRRSAARHGLHGVRVPADGAGYGSQARRRRTGADSSRSSRRRPAVQESPEDFQPPRFPHAMRSNAIAGPRPSISRSIPPRSPTSKR